MNMTKEQMILAGIAGVFGLLLMFIVVAPYFPPIQRAVIEHLKADYSPSEYGPGFDPDKVDVTEFNKFRGNP